MIGQTYSHYRILDKLGQGGMGEVYLAQDTQLDRNVALKFLPTHTLPTDDDRARFYREARSAARLNHPHIAHVYEIDETDDGRAFIAMEYVPGETLAERIRRGPLKLEEAVAIAVQVADGLQAAHDEGIVHRDVKSGNVMLDARGRVKIMDFGLAKVEAASQLTQQGTTVGTIAYMSPEQARGEAVDHRSDIWSLGVVVYEMVTGQVPFGGDYEQAIIYSILNAEPEPLTALRTGVPVALDGVMAKALEKDAGLRYQHVDELAVDLRALEARSGTRSATTTLRTTADTATTPAPARTPVVPWVVTAVMALVAAVALWSPWRTAERADPSVLRLTLPLTPVDLSDDSDFALSPDGTHLVFRGASSADRLPLLFLRAMDTGESMPLQGTDGGTNPFFSPDGMWIGYNSGEELKKVSILGGQPSTLCLVNARAEVSASWGPDDQIIFTHDTPEQHGRLLRVSAQGGTPDTLLATDADGYVAWPHILPGGRAVLVTIFDDFGQSVDNARIVLQRLDGGGRDTLFTGATRPIYIATGHLIFARAGTLTAVPFDLERLAVAGPAVTLTERVLTEQDGARAAFAVSNTGTLVYEPGDVTEQQRGLVWVDRSGIATPLMVPDHDYWDPRLSPDGGRIALHTRATGTEIWVYDALLGSAVRLTFSPAEDETPFWSPDGAWVAYSAQRTDPPRIIARVLGDGSGKEDTLWSGTRHMHVESWSPDGQTILFTDIATESREDLWMLDLADRTARPLLQTPYSERMGRISPDGRWMAYTSDESGTDEIYIQAFPELGRKTTVSTQGGREPVWSKGGRELFYRGEGYLMAVPIEAGRPTAAAQPLFADSYNLGAGNHIVYDVAEDGERFLMVENREGSRGSQLNVVLNWFEEVKARVTAAE